MKNSRGVKKKKSFKKYLLLKKSSFLIIPGHTSANIHIPELKYTFTINQGFMKYRTSDDPWQTFFSLITHVLI